MLVTSGLKTVDGKDIMCYTGAFYLKNEEKIKRIIKKCEEILDAESEDIKKIQRNITIKEDSEKYNLDIYINKKHDKLFKELLSDKKEAVKFINHYLHLNLLDDEIEKYEKEFRTEEFRNIEADVVYKVKNKNVFILIEHQSSLDLKMAYRILRYKNAIIESAINKRRLKEKNYKIPKVIPIVCVMVFCNTKYNTGMLDRLVRIIQFGAYGTHILSLGIHQHLFHPVGCDNLRIIVQQ